MAPLIPILMQLMGSGAGAAAAGGTGAAIAGGAGGAAMGAGAGAAAAGGAGAAGAAIPAATRVIGGAAHQWFAANNPTAPGAMPKTPIPPSQPPGSQGPGLGGLADHFKGISKLMPPWIRQIKELISKLKEWATEVFESQRELRIYNGAISAAFQKVDANRRMLSIQRANDTAGGVESLAESMKNMESAIAPISTDLAIITNAVAKFAADFVAVHARIAKMTRLLDPLVAAAKKYLGKDKIENKNQPVVDWIRELAGGGGQAFKPVGMQPAPGMPGGPPVGGENKGRWMDPMEWARWAMGGGGHDPRKGPPMLPPLKPPIK